MDLSKLFDVTHLLLHQEFQLPAILGEALFLCISVFHLADYFQLDFLQLKGFRTGKDCDVYVGISI